MSYLQRTEIKMKQFREDIKNEIIFEKKLIYLFFPLKIILSNNKIKNHYL